MPRRITVLAAVAAALALSPPAAAYLKLGTFAGTELIGIEWTNQPIRYFITDRSVQGVTPQQLQTAASRAFEEWSRPEDVDLTAQFQSLTGADPHETDGLSVIGFRFLPDLDRTLGSTTWEFNETTGEVLESDIFLNSAFSWSVAASGEAGRFDVESVLVHEVGHFLGLGHSALGETELVSGGRRVLGKGAVMFPIAFGPGSIADRTLDADDIAGITDIYGTSAAEQKLGGIQGRVTLDGAGVFGAHVTAFNPATGDLVSGFTLTPSGNFVIAGLQPGQYVVRVEPLDDADLDGFFGNEAAVELNFRVTYFNKQVAVPAGGTSSAIEIKVRRK